MSDEQRWRLFRDLLGYTGDGSSQSVTLCQDDATGEWMISIGKRTIYGRTLDSVLIEATKSCL